MKISFAFFQRKFNREFEIGVYPEYKFNWKNKRYCINADLDKFYIQYIKPTADEIDEEKMLADFIPTWRMLAEEDPYMLCEYIPISVFDSLIELFENGHLEEDKPIHKIWNEFEFIELDEDYFYYFEKGDSVFVKDKNMYGIVKKIECKNGKTVFWIRPMKTILDASEETETNWIQSEADNLDYDKRPQTINVIKNGYANYLYRL